MMVDWTTDDHSSYGFNCMSKIAMFIRESACFFMAEKHDSTTIQVLRPGEDRLKGLRGICLGPGPCDDQRMMRTILLLHVNYY